MAAPKPENGMTTSSSAAAEAGLRHWQRVVNARAWDQLPDLLSDIVTYRNPSPFDPLQGKDLLVAVLGAVFTIVQDFTYLRSFGGANGHVLEFSAKVGDAPVFGVDILTFDASGKVTDLIVMMRPAGTALALEAEPGRLLGLLPQVG
jgi:hypothetical protein